MALVLGMQIGDKVEIGAGWIRLAAVRGSHAVQIQTSDNTLVLLSDKYETEVFPTIWMGLGPLMTSARIKLAFDAPVTVKIGRVIKRVQARFDCSLTLPAASYRAGSQ